MTTEAPTSGSHLDSPCFSKVLTLPAYAPAVLPFLILPLSASSACLHTSWTRPYFCSTTSDKYLIYSACTTHITFLSLLPLLSEHAYMLVPVKYWSSEPLLKCFLKSRLTY